MINNNTSFQSVLDKIYKKSDSEISVSGPISFRHLQKNGIKNIYIFGDRHFSLKNLCKPGNKNNILFHNFIEKIIKENPDIYFDIGFEAGRFQTINDTKVGVGREDMLGFSIQYFLRNGKLQYYKNLEEKTKDRYHYLDPRTSMIWDSPKIYNSIFFESFELQLVTEGPLFEELDRSDKRYQEEIAESKLWSSSYKLDETVNSLSGNDFKGIFLLKIKINSLSRTTKEFKKGDKFVLNYNSDYDNNTDMIYFLKKEDDSIIFYLNRGLNLNNVKITITVFEKINKLVYNIITRTNEITDRCNNLPTYYTEGFLDSDKHITSTTLNKYKKALYEIYWLFCNTFFVDNKIYENNNNKYLGLDINDTNLDPPCQFPKIYNDKCSKINNFNDTLKVELINKITNIHFVKKFFMKKEKNPSDYTIEIEDIKSYISVRVEELVNNSDIFKNDIIETFANILIKHNFYDRNIPNNIIQQITDSDIYKLRNNIRVIQNLIFYIEVLFMDLYTIIRISKTYQKNVIFYGGDEHSINIMKFYQGLGYNVINENNINSELRYYRDIEIPQIKDDFNINILEYINKIDKLTDDYNINNNINTAIEIDNLISELNYVKTKMDKSLDVLNKIQPTRCINVGDSFNKKHLIS